MKRASITDAKNRLSALLQQVRNGETIIIEDRGVPVAQVSPLAGSGSATDRDRLARLERAGVLRPPRSPKPGRHPLPRSLRTGRRIALSQIVRLERSEGW